VGVESTVVSCVDDARPTILRPGGISQQQLESALGTYIFKTFVVKFDFL
jgi:tRNA A37 threonylcarbamoyladenosine synthetase subunit TsaC/SUA5/YrdC